MDDETAGAGRHGGVRKRIERRPRVLIVDADAALDRHWHRCGGLHGGDAVADQRWLRHQASAEAAVAHAVRRTADIEIDLIESRICANARRRRKCMRLAAAELD